MIVVRHHPSPMGWEFIAPKCNLSGGGRTVEESKDSAEHIARHYFSEVQGYPVEHSVARALVQHVVEADLVAA